MAWTAPMTAVANTAFTAAQFNTFVRDNLMETAPAKATDVSSYFVGAGANSIVERFPVEQFIEPAATTSSTSYADLSGSFGPTVTVDTGTRALVMYRVAMSTNTTGQSCTVSFEVTGDSSVPAQDKRGITIDGVDSGNTLSIAGMDLTDLVTPGTNTFTLKYKVSGGVGTFSNRQLIVLPL